MKMPAAAVAVVVLNIGILLVVSNDYKTN